MQQTAGSAVQVNAPLPDVLVLRGAPGAGKSSAAKCLASLFPGGARVEVDLLRRMIISVDWKNQEEHIRMLDAAAGFANDLAKFGFRPVIVIDTFSGDKLPRFLDVLRRLHAARTFRAFALHAEDEVLRGRLALRPADEFKDFAISRKLNADVSRFRYPGELLIDTSSRTPEGVAAMILDALTRTSRRGGAGSGSPCAP
jgi:predicted kinase